MGCFSIAAQKARKKLRHQTQLPHPKPCFAYHNKPTVLPHPQDVEEQGRYTRTLSTPSQLQFSKAATRSPSVYRQSRALSAPARVTLYDPYTPPVAVSVADDAQSPSSPLSNRILPLSDPPLCERINRKAFGGRPVPLPSPLLPAAHPLPSPKANHPSPSETLAYNSATPLAFSPSRCPTPSREGNGRLADHNPRLSSSSKPKPLPQPPPETRTLAIAPRVFAFNEIAAASQNFSTDRCIGDTGSAIAYRSWISSQVDPRKKTEVSVLQLTAPPTFTFTFQDPEVFAAEATKMCSLQHPHLCKLIGFCTEDSPQPKGVSNKRNTRFLVFESLPNGTAEKLLYGRQEGCSLDWSTRVKIGVGAAKGLAYLHEHPSGEILYRDFCTFNIQIDKEFNPKLMGYGFINRCPNKLLPVTAHVSPETAASGRVSPKSNVWSFGVVLLELLGGRRNLDSLSCPQEQRHLKKFAADCNRLYLDIDPQLKGCYPIQDAKLIADLALKCLHQEPDLRPSMKEVVKILSLLEDQSSTTIKCPPENTDMYPNLNLSSTPYLSPCGKHGFLSPDYKATVSEAL